MTRIFISYSHKDDQYRAELETHMAMLKRDHLVDVWSDHRILAGEALDPTISAALEAADVILLLVSADFINSDYCFGVEMTRALQRNAEKTAIVVPIIVRPCDWKSSVLRGLKAIPEDGLAITKWPSLDDGFLDVVVKLRALLNALHQKTQASGGKEFPRRGLNITLTGQNALCSGEQSYMSGCWDGLQKKACLSSCLSWSSSHRFRSFFSLSP